MSKTTRLPSLFISHGSPMTVLQDDSYTQALRSYCSSLSPRPKAIVVVSAHGTTPEGMVEITASSRPQLVYDFGGFPRELYQQEYPCPGSPELAAQIAGLCVAQGFAASLNAAMGLDHGTWIPLKLAFPEADIPVVQVTVPHPTQPQNVLKLGKALAPLREEGVLLIGSGGLVHNLGQLVWHQKNGPAAPWAQKFDDWVFECLEDKDVASLCDFEDIGPDARLAHPTTDHFYPVFFTVGASLLGDQARAFHREIQYETLSMSCFSLTS